MRSCSRLRRSEACCAGCPRSRSRCCRRSPNGCRPSSNRASPLSYTCRMAATATERALLIDGEWVETGEWLEVRSPYSGDVVGRVAKGGAAETRQALDAAARVLAEPLPAH